MRAWMLVVCKALLANLRCIRSRQGADAPWTVHWAALSSCRCGRWLGGGRKEAKRTIFGVAEGMERRVRAPFHATDQAAQFRRLSTRKLNASVYLHVDYVDMIVFGSASAAAGASTMCVKTPVSFQCRQRS
jgi:hypothetical protein